MPVEERCAIAAQCFYGLQYLQQKKVVHQDLKPDNILVSLTSFSQYCSAKLLELPAMDDVGAISLSALM